MTPDDWLVAARESSGPDVDARTRLMGRLAALGPPQEAAVSKRRIWPWVVATGTLAAAVFLLWQRPESQRLAEGSREAGQASDQASLPAADRVALPKTPSTTVRTRDVPALEAPTVPAAPETVTPHPIAGPTTPQSPGARARNRRPSRDAPEAKSPPAPPSEPDAVDTLAAEAALISRARAALSRGEAPKALKHLREYDDRFEAPSLREEAAALRAMARCASEGPDEETAAAFGREFSHSMFRKRVRRACAVEAE